MHKTVHHITLQPQLPRFAARSKYSRQRRHSWRALGAALGLIGGVISPVLGGLLINHYAALAGRNHLFDLLGVVLYIVTTPLLFFGGWCLSLIADDAIPTQTSQGPARPHPYFLAMTRKMSEVKKSASL